MSIIRHHEQPTTKGFYSKILNRKLVTSEVGAHACTVWEQIIPPGGYITRHYHEFEETLTFVAGVVQVTLGDQLVPIEAETTIFIPPGVVHSVQNPGPEPARLLAFLVSADPQVRYPDGTPDPVDWERHDGTGPA